METASGAARMVSKPVDDDLKAAAAAPEPWLGREKAVCSRGALLVGGLLLACFVLGRESASSMPWLQIDVAKTKLTDTTNGTAGTDVRTVGLLVTLSFLSRAVYASTV
jgi:xyloglucan fucosyltransferase